MNPNSYLIREAFDNNDIKQVKEQSRQVSSSTIAKIVQNHLVKAGIRTPFSNANKDKDKDKNVNRNKGLRHKKAQDHAFRKYFETCLINCDVNVVITKMLMGQKTGLEDSYYRPNEKKLLSEYSKAINELTINEENRLRKQVTELESKQSEIDLMKYQHQMEMKQIEDRIDAMCEKLSLTK